MGRQASSGGRIGQLALGRLGPSQEDEQEAEQVSLWDEARGEVEVEPGRLGKGLLS